MAPAPCTALDGARDLSGEWSALRALPAARDGPARAKAQIVALRKGGRLGGLARVVAEHASAATGTDLGNHQITVLFAHDCAWR